jgi:hypothetical protein
MREGTRKQIEYIFQLPMHHLLLQQVSLPVELKQLLLGRPRFLQEESLMFFYGLDVDQYGYLLLFHVVNSVKSKDSVGDQQIVKIII